jgi:hypothetical protein
MTPKLSPLTKQLVEIIFNPKDAAPYGAGYTGGASRCRDSQYGTTKDGCGGLRCTDQAVFGLFLTPWRKRLEATMDSHFCAWLA